MIHAVGDRLDDLRNLPADFVQFAPRNLKVGTTLHPQPVHLPGELVAELPEQRRVHQMLAQPVQDRRFEGITSDVEPVVASALVARSRAAEQVLGDHRIAAPAAAAFDEAGKEMLRAAPVVQGIGTGLDHIIGKAALPCLDGIPDVLVDEAQVRHLMDDPFAFRVQAGYAPAGVGILDIAQPVPDQLADIKLVVQDAGAALRVRISRDWGSDFTR